MGLLYVFPKVVRVAVIAQLLDDPKIAANERPLLCAALRRVYIRGDLPKIYKQETLKVTKQEDS